MPLALSLDTETDCKTFCKRRVRVGVAFEFWTGRSARGAPFVCPIIRATNGIGVIPAVINRTANHLETARSECRLFRRSPLFGSGRKRMIAMAERSWDMNDASAAFVLHGCRSWLSVARIPPAEFTLAPVYGSESL